MATRLKQLAHDYTKAVDVKMKSQAKRMLRENVAATSQLTLLSDQTTELLRDNDRTRRSETQLKVRLNLMESLEHQWAKKLRSSLKVYLQPNN